MTVSLTVALTPTAGEEEKSVARGTSRSRVRAAPTIAVAKGCSLSVSAAAANAKMSSSVWSPTRSEEHTSELQSRGHLVCRLLLEKKNKKESIGRTHA